MLSGIDVSNYQGQFNWAGRQPKPAFGFAKASEGISFADADFTWNWQQMGRLSILRAAYHYGHPNLSAQAQAEYFVTHVDHAGQLGADDVLALDLEENDGLPPAAVAAWAVQFCGEVEALTHKNCWVYTTHDYISGGYTAGLQGRPLWIASPGTAGQPGAIAPWPVWTVHQYASSPLDENVFNGTAAQWGALANMPTAKPPVKPPVPAPKPTITGVVVKYSDGSSKAL